MPPSVNLRRVGRGGVVAWSGHLGIGITSAIRRRGAPLILASGLGRDGSGSRSPRLRPVAGQRVARSEADTDAKNFLAEEVRKAPLHLLHEQILDGAR